MVLVDTSVWIAHFRRASPALQALLHDGRVSCHAAVIGELACGTLRARDTTLALLRQLPRVSPATDEEALVFLERRRLFGSGLGWTDVHLLAAATTSDHALWTLDRRLDGLARALRLAYRAGA